MTNIKVDKVTPLFLLISNITYFCFIFPTKEMLHLGFSLNRINEDCFGKELSMRSIYFELDIFTRIVSFLFLEKLTISNLVELLRFNHKRGEMALFEGHPHLSSLRWVERSFLGFIYKICYLPLKS